MTQLGLSFAETIQQRFWAFHEAHPEVYAELVRLAREARDQRLDRRYGIRTLWEVMRWNLRMEWNDAHKLNDHYTSRYARMIAEREPDLAGMFETRSLRAD
jgi:lipopolysaccharide/colanic/teichoic acid biosynthesis glycosyltransferase